MMQPPADPAPDSMATDDATQLTQPLSQPPADLIPETHLWGSLIPCSANLRRVDFQRHKPSYRVGRNGSNDVIFPGMKISNLHCQITWDGVESKDAAIKVTDSSSNGTFINGKRMARGSWLLLHDGNEIGFGSATPQTANSGIEDYRFVFRLLAAGAPESGLHKYYQLHMELGKGSFATVMKALHRETGEWYAIKIIQRSKLRSPTSASNPIEGTPGSAFSREINILEKLQHPNICCLKEVFYEDWNINMVLEFIPGGDLLDYILNRHGLEEPAAQNITFQICEAVAYVHAMGIAHRDLKPENVLLTRDDPPVVKVADFGLAKAVDSVTMLRTMCGTPCYLAPEVISQEGNQGYDNLVDSWSVGVIVFSMLTESSPFIEDETLELHARIRTRQVDWSLLHQRGISEAGQDFIRCLLTESPAERMTLTDARAHPWLLKFYHGAAPPTLPRTTPLSRPTSPLLFADASMLSSAMSVDAGAPASDAPMPDASDALAPPASQTLAIPGAFPASQPVARDGSRALLRRAQVLREQAQEAPTGPAVVVASPSPSEMDVEEGERDTPAPQRKRKAALSPMDEESGDELPAAGRGARGRTAQGTTRGRRKPAGAKRGAAAGASAEEHGGVQRHPRRSNRLVSTPQKAGRRA